jgi:hypothetical protein
MPISISAAHKSFAWQIKHALTQKDLNMPDRLNTNIQSYDALRAAIATAMPFSNRLDGLFLAGNC